MFEDPRYQPSLWGFATVPSDARLVGDPLGWPRDLGESANDGLTLKPGGAAVGDTPGLSPLNAALLRFAGLDSVSDVDPRLVNGSREPGGSAQARSVGSKLSTDNTPIPFTDAYGNPVLTPDGEPMMIPRGVDQLFFVNRGLADATAGPWAIIRGLRNFGQGRDWDLQRQGPDDTPDQNFVDAATVALGLYGSAAGIYPADLLRLQSFYAMFNSDFGKAVVSPKYDPLPVRNVMNTLRGYELHRSGRIGPTPAAP